MVKNVTYLKVKTKASRHYSVEVKKMVNALELNYLVPNATERHAIIADLQKCFYNVTPLGEIQSNLLGFSRRNPKTQCALDIVRTDMKQIQEKIIDSIVQIHVNNDDDMMTHHQIEASMAPRRQEIVERSIIHDNQSLEQNLILSRNLIKEFTLDKNKLDYSKSITSKHSALGKQSRNLTKNQVQQIKAESDELTSVIMDVTTTTIGAATSAMGAVTISTPTSPLTQPLTPRATNVGQF